MSKFGCCHRRPLPSQSPQPHLEDSSVYRQNRPTKLDKIKNLYDQVPVANLTGSHGMAKPICTGDGEFDTLEKQPFRLRTTSRR